MKKLMFPKERKLLAVILMLAMVFSCIGVYQTSEAQAAGRRKMSSETVTGTLADGAVRDASVATPQAVNIVTDKVVESNAWWSEPTEWASYPLTLNTPLDIYVGGEFDGDAGEFAVEIRSTKDPYECFTTLTNHDAWLFVTGQGNQARNDDTNRAKKVAKNHVYKITTTWASDTVTVVYYDMTDAQEFARFTTTVESWPTSGTTVCVRSQIGSYRVGTSLSEDPQPTPTPVASNIRMLTGAKQNAVFVMDDPAIVGEDITWTVDDPAIAEISADGVITAKAAGETSITAQKGETTVTKTLNVINHVAANASSPAMQVGEDGVYLTCRSTTAAGSTENWASPRLLVNNGALTYTVRADLWVEDGGAGFGMTNLGPDVNWPSFLAENLQGVDCYISAVKIGDNIRVRMTTGSISGETFIPVVEGNDVIVTLTNWKCDMTDVQAVDKYHFNDPGPTIPVPPSYPGSVVTPKPVITPGPVIDVPIAVEDIKVEQSLTGTAWWEGNTVGQDYALSGKEVSMVLYVGASKLLNDYGAFNIELVSDGKYLTTGSDLNAWTAGDGVTGSISGIADEANRVSALKAGHVYRITVTRKGNDITVNYYDATEQKDYFEVKASGVNFSDNMNVHVIAQVGTFEVGQQVETGDNPTTGPDVTAAPSAGPDETAAPTKEPDATAGPSSEPTKEPGATTEPSAEPTKEPGGSTGAKPGSKVTVSGSTYKVNAGTQVTYTAKKKAAAAVTVPATVKIKGKTYKVTSIAANAFKGNKAVKKITVGKNVTKIGKNAFGGCKKLKTIVIKSTKLKASKVTKGAFKGVTKKTVIKVPKAKVKAYRKMFRKKGLNKKVKVKAV